MFDPNGLPPRVVAALSAAKEKGKSLAEVPGGRAATPADALAALAEHALGDPILVDVTADESTPLIRQALGAGMDVVLANKRPISGPRAESEALAALAESAGRRLLTEATVGAGLPIFDTHRKLVESGDRVLKIEGCLSGTLGFVLTEVEKGRSFSAALGRAMELGYTEPDPRDDLSGVDVGRKALILGRLLAFAGEPADVAVESLVPDAMKALPREAVPRASPRRRRRLVAPRRRRQGQGRHAPLRRDGHQGPDLRRAEGRRPRQPVLRPQGDRQPGRLHDLALPQEPAGHHRPRRRPGGHGGRRAQRHAPRQRLTHAPRQRLTAASGPQIIARNQK